MRILVIYNSQTGFTRRYAEWIVEELKCDIMPFAEAKRLDFWADYDAIIFGSWVSAEKIKDIDWLKQNMIKHPAKKYLVYVVGASPAESPMVEEMLKLNMLSEKHSEKCTMVYCPGGLCYEKMSFFNRVVMKIFARMVAKKKDKTEAEAQMAKMIGQSYDISDRRYIEPVVRFIRRFEVMD